MIQRNQMELRFPIPPIIWSRASRADLIPNPPELFSHLRQLGRIASWHYWDEFSLSLFKNIKELLPFISKQYYLWFWLVPNIYATKTSWIHTSSSNTCSLRGVDPSPESGVPRSEWGRDGRLDVATVPSVFLRRAVASDDGGRAGPSMNLILFSILNGAGRWNDLETTE